MNQPHDPRRAQPPQGAGRPVPPPQAWAQRGRVAVPPPQVPRPAPARGGSGAYHVSAGLRRPTVPPRPPVQGYGAQPLPQQRVDPRAPAGYRPPAPPQQYRQPPQGYRPPQQPYRQVPRPPVPAAPPRAVPAAHWSVPTPGRGPAPYPGAAGYRPGGWAPAAPPAATRGGGNTWVVALLVAIVLLVAALLGSAVVFLERNAATEAGGTTTVGPTATLSGSATTGASPTITVTPTGTAALQDNPLFANASLGLPSQPCSADGWPSDEAAGKRFFDSLAPCLDRAWEQVVGAVGMPYRKPTVIVPTGTRLSSPCGNVNLETDNVAAFYCSSNETLYMPPKGLQVEDYGNKPVVYLAVFAHEYGHHVQHLTGILSAEVKLERQYGRTSARGLEMSRRTELQAQCFSGLFLKSVSDTGGQFTRADYSTAYDTQDRGDQPGGYRDHGTSAHTQAWWDTGYQSNRVARCNTWAASSSDVS